MDDRLPARAPARNPWIQGDLGSGQPEVTARQPPRPAGGPGETFDVVALTVLPTLYLLGAFTFVRIVECGAEDFRCGVAINRIRNYYKQIAGNRRSSSCCQATTTRVECSPTRQSRRDRYRW